jgi:hypothetical protein
MGRWRILNPVVISLMIGTATQSPAGTSCKPVITFKEVRFSKAQNQQREWDRSPVRKCLAMRHNFGSI